MEIWLVSALLVVTFYLLVTERIPIDLTAVGIMVALALAGILTPAEAVSGFANPAVVTVGALLLVSKAMIRTGAVGFIGQKVIALSRGKAGTAMLVTLLIVGAASAFINNTPVVVLFIPIITSLSCEYGLSPSKFLIPVSYASILAGTCTLIGTSTNIIVSDLSALSGSGSIGMFELSPLGVPIALLGIAFLSLAAPRLMPSHASPTCEVDGRPDRRYLAELIVVEGSLIIGRSTRTPFAEEYPSLELFEVVRGARIFFPDQEGLLVQAGDLLLVKGSPTELLALLNARLVELPHGRDWPALSPGDKESIVAELIIPPESSFIGDRLAETRLYRDHDIHIIAVKRRRLHYSAQKVRTMSLDVGDILLIQCHQDKLEELRGDPDFIVVEDVHHEIIHKRLAGRALAIFAGLIMAASTGLADIMVCALAAALLMILSGCLQLRDAYRAIQGNVLLLIVGSLALGVAMEKTGAARFYADQFLSLLHGMGPRAVLLGILLLTSICTHIISNNATAVLLIPIAISTALGLGVHPKPFIIAVCFGASACFATPIAYKTNLLVYGPGGYRFTDYLKLGLPLNLLVLITGTVFIPRIWPF